MVILATIPARLAGAHVSVRFPVKHSQTRTRYPFAIYCFVVGLGSVLHPGLIK